MQDVQLKNDISIFIHGFETVYGKRPDGTLEEVDTVTWSPRGDDKTKLTDEIRRISQVTPLEDCGDNLSRISAFRFWERIETAYKAWKANETVPVVGTPLAAWPGVIKAQAEVLKGRGFRTVEELAGASDIEIGRIGLANGVMLRDSAKVFLANDDKAKAAADRVRLEAENREMREQMGDMMKLMQEMKAERDAEKAAKPRKARAATVEDVAEEVAA
jgi:hypothetical protein